MPTVLTEAFPSEAADLVAPSEELEELRQAHTLEEVAASADLEPQIDVVVVHFSPLLKLLRTDGIK